MSRIAHFFIVPVKKLQKKLETILELNWGPNTQESKVNKLSINARFEMSSDLSQIEYIGWELPNQASERNRELFYRLRPYFEMGLHLNLQDQNSTQVLWQANNFFACGSKLNIHQNSENIFLRTSHLRLDEIKCLKLSMIKDFEPSDQSLISELAFRFGLDTESSVLFFRTTDLDLWLLFSNRPDIFLQNLVSKLHPLCLQLLADSFENEKELRL